jgi:hypothetical protein
MIYRPHSHYIWLDAVYQTPMGSVKGSIREADGFGGIPGVGGGLDSTLPNCRADPD